MDVAVFCFNRADKLRMCLDSIDLSHVETLWIFSDGPRDSGDVVAVDETRQVATEFIGDRKKLIFRPHNFGPPKNVIEGLDQVFEHSDCCLILEDDCIVRREAYAYINWALDRYRNDAHVFSVNTMAPLSGLPNRVAAALAGSDVVATSRIFAFWGWATWADRWKEFRSDLEPFRNPYGRASATPISYGTHIRWALERFEEGKVGAWDARLAVLVGHASKLHLHPTRSLMRNVGFDGSGVHFRATEHPVTDLRDLSFVNFTPRLTSTGPAIEDHSVRILQRASTILTFVRVKFLATLPTSLRSRLRRILVRREGGDQY